jgi:hypothetical protein
MVFLLAGVFAEKEKPRFLRIAASIGNLFFLGDQQCLDRLASFAAAASANRKGLNQSLPGENRVIIISPRGRAAVAP